jgi:pyruvate dehydrogenase E1 component alpha subunit
MTPDTATRRTLLREMIRIRRFEEKCAELYSAGKIRGFLHLYIGEEAIAAGTMPNLGPDDAIVATYREHGHALARGVPAGAVMAEMYGKQEGCSRGRGGSMHLFDVSRRFYGGNAIVCGGLPVATGLALADKMLGRPRRDGLHLRRRRRGRGRVPREHEPRGALEAARAVPLREQPLRDGHVARTLGIRDRPRREGGSYRMAAASVDGMDAAAVERRRARGRRGDPCGGAPQFLELRTYRFRAHSMFDAELYRDKAEVAEWRRRCPIAALTAQLR